MFCPAHLQPAYLREIGADDATLLTDQSVVQSRDKDAAIDAPDTLARSSTPPASPVRLKVRKQIAQLDAEARVLEDVWGSRAGRTVATVSHQHIYGMLFRLFWPVFTAGVFPRTARRNIGRASRQTWSRHDAGQQPRPSHAPARQPPLLQARRRVWSSHRARRCRSRRHGPRATCSVCCLSDQCSSSARDRRHRLAPAGQRGCVVDAPAGCARGQQCGRPA